jgi:alkanesulfonate monooxygenase SsuD/methylene tetrahydromethanopterin reductase-like flavin-dependent oxidoreductase (luciferase family)
MTTREDAMAMTDDLQFNMFHFMPYAHLPEDHQKYESVWVDFPNSIYDPVKANKLYARYLSEMVLADKLGFDGLVVNEHHSTAYSMMPAPSLIAAALIPQTKRAKLCVFGTPLTLEYPHRVAEEYGMLDVMSGGRLEVALPLGTGMEYWVNPINPVTARARFKESIDVLLQAWREPGPTAFQGDFYTYRFLNVWPRPYQKPHPKIYLVGTGSLETIQLAAEYGFGYSSVFVPITRQMQAFADLRERSPQYGHQFTRDKAIIGVMAYVAETKEKAEQEWMEHLMFFFKNMLRTTPRFLVPPGYVTTQELRKRMTGPNLHGDLTWEALTQQFFVTCGTPDMVAEAIAGWSEQAQSSRINCFMHLGSMPHWMTVKNITLFAEEVIPRLRSKAPNLQPALAQAAE